MNCGDFEVYIDELLDERAPLNLDDEAATHYSSCAACRALYGAYRDLDATVRRAGTPAVPVELARQAVERVFWIRRRRRAAWAIAGVVAASLVVATTVHFASVNRRPGENPPIVVRDSGGTKEKAPESAPPMSELARDAQRRYLSLAEQTQESLTEAVQLMSPQATSAPAPNQEMPAIGVQTNALAEQVADGFKPLARSTAGAMNFLFGVVPGEDAGESEKDET